VYVKRNGAWIERWVESFVMYSVGGGRTVSCSSRTKRLMIQYLEPEFIYIPGIACPR
jgi:hypothetical protein